MPTLKLKRLLLLSRTVGTNLGGKEGRREIRGHKKLQHPSLPSHREKASLKMIKEYRVRSAFIAKLKR